MERTPDDTDEREREPREGDDATPNGGGNHWLGVAAKVGVIIAFGALGYGFAALTDNMGLQSESGAFEQSRTDAVACVRRYESMAKAYGDKDVDEHLASDLEDACRKALRLAGVDHVTSSTLDGADAHGSAREVREGREAPEGQKDAAKDCATGPCEDHYERIMTNARQRLGSIAANTKGLAEGSERDVQG